MSCNHELQRAPSIPIHRLRANDSDSTFEMLENALFQEVFGDSSLITLLYESPSANLASSSRKITIV